MAVTKKNPPPPDKGTPLPGSHHNMPATELATLLEGLITVSGQHVIPSPASAPDHPTMTDAFDKLLLTAQDFEVIPGMRLADHLWTHVAPLRSGEVAANLIRRGVPWQAAHGFLLLYAVDARSPLLYLPQGQPLRVRDGIEIVPEAARGPFLALVRCEAAVDGRAQAIQACAMPIYHARRFTPVAADLGRDVLRALEHLQVAFDAHGVECAIRRELPFSGREPALFTLSLSLSGQSFREIRLAIADDECPGDRAACYPPVDFLVTAANWKDGTFGDWLGKALP